MIDGDLVGRKWDETAEFLVRCAYGTTNVMLIEADQVAILDLQSDRVRVRLDADRRIESVERG